MKVPEGDLLQESSLSSNSVRKVCPSLLHEPRTILRSPSRAQSLNLIVGNLHWPPMLAWEAFRGYNRRLSLSGSTHDDCIWRIRPHRKWFEDLRSNILTKMTQLLGYHGIDSWRTSLSQSDYAVLLHSWTELQLNTLWIVMPSMLTGITSIGTRKAWSDSIFIFAIIAEHTTMAHWALSRLQNSCCLS